MASHSTEFDAFRRNPSRRAFLTSAAVAAAGLSLPGRRVVGLPRAFGSHSATTLLPDPTPDSALRAYALAALDVARAAGATYADIRIADSPRFAVSVAPGGFPPDFGADAQFSFGIRVIVDGASAFTYGNHPDLDAITTAARNAVASARGLGQRRAVPTELTPTPAVTGEWETPMSVDPYSIPLQAHWDVLGGYIAIAERIKNASVNPSGIAIRWERETRVFASTDGTMVTQRFRRALFDIGVNASYVSMIGFPLNGEFGAIGGFELATDPTLHERILHRTEDAARLASLPITSADVGRYDIVVAGNAMVALAGQTIAPALELDRVLGHEAGATGTSYLAPALDVLGTPAFSPLLTITSDRDASTAEYAHWDDDGVACGQTTLIDRGRVVDFLTSRATAGALGPWYERQGRPVRSNGNSNTGLAAWMPLPRAGHATIRAEPTGPTLDALCGEVKRGLLIYDGNLNVDQQLASFFYARPLAFEIVNGRVTRRVNGCALQATTKRFWGRSLKAIGGASTVTNRRITLWKSQPRQYAFHTMSAPAGLFADVDIAQVPR